MPDIVFVLMMIVFVLLATAVRYTLTRRMLRKSGQREDGTWEPGRALSDMTVVGKVAIGVALAAFAVMAVLRFMDDGPAWLWATTAGIGAVAVVTGIVSERRRVRREGVDIGHGPGRLRADE